MSNSHTEVYSGTLQEALEHLVKPETVASPEPEMRGSLAEAIRFAVPPTPAVAIEDDDSDEPDGENYIGEEE